MLLKRGIIISAVEKTADLTEFKTGSIVTNDTQMLNKKIVRKNENITNKDGWNRLHLYLFVEDDAKAGDFIINSNKNSKTLVEKTDKDIEDVQVLVATTDSRYLCARVPKWFIQKYVENEQNEVLIQYEETLEKLIPKKNKEHYIQLGETKEIYTGEEVKDLFFKLANELDEGKYSFTIENWINENL